jgi:hypothetical protein
VNIIYWAKEAKVLTTNPKKNPMSHCWNNKLCSNWAHQVYPTKKCHYKQIWNELKEHGKTLGFKNLIINNACKATFPMLWFVIVLLQTITSIKRWTKMQQHTYGKGSFYVYCNKYKFPFLPRPIMIHQLPPLVCLCTCICISLTSLYFPLVLRYLYEWRFYVSIKF